MARLALAALTLALVSLTGLATADDKKADDKPPKVEMMPPHPLDGLFEKAATDKQIEEGLLNNDLFKKAVKAALEAKQEREAFNKKNPKVVGPSPAQAARVKFLEVMRSDKSDEKPGK